jgi:hypothetical protein
MFRLILIALAIGAVRAQGPLHAGADQSGSGQLTRICKDFFPNNGPDFACTCQPSKGGNGPFPFPVKPQAQPAGIFVQQQGEDPQFVANQPANNNGPIIIQLKPQDINVNQQNAPAPPPIAAQGLTPPAPPPPPAAPAEVDLTDLVFIGAGDAMVTRCPKDQKLTWTHKTWTDGGTRPYYEFGGVVGSFDECLKSCENRPECFFCSMHAGSRRCYHLTTNNGAVCRYHRDGHFGALGERCTPKTPCPSAYKLCVKPICSLRSIIEVFCKTSSKWHAVNTCSL